jgi:DNA repair protein RecN (Recombination protein N)
VLYDLIFYKRAVLLASLLRGGVEQRVMGGSISGVVVGANETAGVVGDRLAAVAARRQVLCVTHLAQIAARAGHHVRITKSVQGRRSRASVETLRGEPRVAEIARMLGGETKAGLEHARELLAETRRS